MMQCDEKNEKQQTKKQETKTLHHDSCDAMIVLCAIIQRLVSI